MQVSWHFRQPQQQPVKGTGSASRGAGGQSQIKGGPYVSGNSWRGGKGTEPKLGKKISGRPRDHIHSRIVKSGLFGGGMDLGVNFCRVPMRSLG